MDRKDRQRDSASGSAGGHRTAAGGGGKPEVAKRSSPAARESAQGRKDDDGPLDSLGRAVTDTVTGSLPEEVPGSTSPDPDDPARP